MLTSRYAHVSVHIRGNKCEVLGKFGFSVLLIPKCLYHLATLDFDLLSHIWKTSSTSLNKFQSFSIPLNEETARMEPSFVSGIIKLNLFFSGTRFFYKQLHFSFYFFSMVHVFFKQLYFCVEPRVAYYRLQFQPQSCLVVTYFCSYFKLKSEVAIYFYVFLILETWG